MQGGAERLIKILCTPVTSNRSRLGTSTCLMKCQSLESEGWERDGKEGVEKKEE